jgi:hypothetical protein
MLMALGFAVFLLLLAGSALGVVMLFVGGACLIRSDWRPHFKVIVAGGLMGVALGSLALVILRQVFVGELATEVVALVLLASFGAASFAFLLAFLALRWLKNFAGRIANA